jgi:hypothetical protein
MNDRAQLKIHKSIEEEVQKLNSNKRSPRKAKIKSGASHPLKISFA